MPCGCGKGTQLRVTRTQTAHPSNSTQISAPQRAQKVVTREPSRQPEIERPVHNYSMVKR
jgi:hypothetical protein